jgi:hypothetical protein
MSVHVVLNKLNETSLSKYGVEFEDCTKEQRKEIMLNITSISK